MTDDKTRAEFEEFAKLRIPFRLIEFVDGKYFAKAPYFIGADGFAMAANEALYWWQAAKERYGQPSLPQDVEAVYMFEAGCSGLRYPTAEACGEVSAIHINGVRYPVIPAGKVLVPVEPTKEMVVAGHHAAWRRIPSIFDFDDAENVYKAMLTASKGE